MNHPQFILGCMMFWFPITMMAVLKWTPKQYEQRYGLQFITALVITVLATVSTLGIVLAVKAF